MIHSSQYQKINVFTWLVAFFKGDMYKPTSDRLLDDLLSREIIVYQLISYIYTIWYRVMAVDKIY